MIKRRMKTDTLAIQTVAELGENVIQVLKIRELWINGLSACAYPKFSKSGVCMAVIISEARREEVMHDG